MDKVFVLVFCLLFCELTTLAYLDPASGSMVLQAVLAVVAGVYVTLKIFWVKIRNLFAWKK